MGEAGHDAGGVFPRAGDKRNLQRPQRGVGAVTGIAHPQAEVGGHLIVAAARGVEPPRGRTDQFRQPAFGGHVDVFQVPVLGHALGFILRRNLVQPAGNQRRIPGRDNLLRCQHVHMGL